MKKKVFILIGILIFIVLVSYLLLDIMLESGYRISIVDGKPSGLTQYHDEEYYVTNALRDRAIVIRNGDSRSIYKLDELGAVVNLSGYESSKYTINIQNLSYSIDISNIEYMLRDDLEKMLSERSAGSVGYFDIIDDNIIIVGSEQGNLFDVDAIMSNIALHINREEIVSVNVDDYLLEQDKDIVERQNELIATLESYDNFSIEYTDDFVITKDILYKYGLLNVNEDSIEIVEDEDKIIKMLVRNLVDYNSIGIDRRFHTHDDKFITVTGGTYGDYIDYSSEAAEIIAMLKELESDTDRVPVMKQKAKFSLDTTYIEVDKVKQHIYYYVDGELVLDSDVVTGKPTADRITPSGVYFILNKTTDANLIGATWNVKSDRWMGVTYQGVGFHDANWRSKFGGEIYKSNGSHGCINTPKEAMFKLYDMVEEGTPVIIY